LPSPKSTTRKAMPSHQARTSTSACTTHTWCTENSTYRSGNRIAGGIVHHTPSISLFPLEDANNGKSSMRCTHRRSTVHPPHSRILMKWSSTKLTFSSLLQAILMSLLAAHHARPVREHREDVPAQSASHDLPDISLASRIELLPEERRIRSPFPHSAEKASQKLASDEPLCLAAALETHVVRLNQELQILFRNTRYWTAHNHSLIVRHRDPCRRRLLAQKPHQQPSLGVRVWKCPQYYSILPLVARNNELHQLILQIVAFHAHRNLLMLN
jgi:hypothetical protein